LFPPARLLYQNSFVPPPPPPPPAPPPPASLSSSRCLCQDRSIAYSKTSSPDRAI
jgi:hypothetical protein